MSPKNDFPKWIIQKTEILPLSESKTARWNPRLITDEQFERLKKSIQEDPQFLALRPILRTKKGTVYAGSMRFRACTELGYPDAPFITTDISEDEAKKRSLRDNNHFGEYQMEELAQLSADVGLTTLQMELMGLPQNLIRALTGPTDKETGEEVSEDALRDKTEHECPKCGHKF